MSAEQMKSSDEEFIAEAVGYLESPSFLLRLTNLVGQPVEKTLNLLPEKTKAVISSATEKALAKAIDVAVKGIEFAADPPEPGIGPVREIGGEEEQGRLRRLRLRGNVFSGVSGFIGGFMGPATLPLELPVSTVLMMRSIAEVAGQYGEDLNKGETRLECLTIFSLGGPATSDDALESSYYICRLGMAHMVREAAQFMAKASAQGLANAVSQHSAPVLVRLISSIAARFKVVVGQKLLAQSLPILGGAAGAAVNVAFNDHFSTVAKYHFGLRALEKKYGEAEVKRCYERHLQAQRNRQKERAANEGSKL